MEGLIRNYWPRVMLIEGSPALSEPVFLTEKTEKQAPRRVCKSRGLNITPASQSLWGSGEGRGSGDSERKDSEVLASSRESHQTSQNLQMGEFVAGPVSHWLDYRKSMSDPETQGCCP